MSTTQIISFRPPTNDDARSLSNLITQLGYPISLEDTRIIIESYSSQNNHFAYLAIIDSYIVGAVSIIVNNYFHKVGKIAIVSAMIIDENNRRQGIGKQLLNHAEKQARQLGCEFVELKSGIRRIKDGTHDFYRDLGYFDNAINQTYFKKSLS